MEGDDQRYAMIHRIQARTGWSNAEMAKHGGVTEPAIRNYLNGVSPPKFTVLAKLVEAAGGTIRLEWDDANTLSAADREMVELFKTAIPSIGPRTRRALRFQFQDFVETPDDDI